MKSILQKVKYSVVLLLVLLLLYLANLFFMRPLLLDHFLAKELIIELVDSPEALTSIGLFDALNPITGHNSKWSLTTLADEETDYQESLARLEVLQGYQTDELSDDEKISQAIAVFSTQNSITGFESFRFHDYPLNQIGGAHLNLLEFMTDIHPIRNKREAEDFIARVKLLDEVSENLLAWLEQQQEAGIFAPEFVYDHVIRQLKEILAYQDQHPLRQVFKDKTTDIGLAPEVISALSDDLGQAIDEHLNVGYGGLLNYLEETYDQANQHDGVWSLPSGDAYYQLRLRASTTTDYSPEAIHQLGLSEVERITLRMRVILNDLGYDPGRPVGLLMNDLNENPEFLYDDTPDRKALVVSDFNKMVEDAQVKITAYFNRMPEASVIVKAIPEYSEETQAGGYYMQPSLDGSRPGVFYANLYDIKQTPSYSMQTLAFHEAVPGHHLQIALNMENEALSLYRRFGYGTSAFSEGWALYAEKLAVEAGLLNNSYDELGVLQSELFRAVRLVVDTGIHYKKWSRQTAIRYMKDMTGMSDTEVRTEIERYIVWPGQACSYKMGMLKILEMRGRARSELGDLFDIREFHSVILDHGQPPMFILDILVSNWIARKKLNEPDV
ncbi:MAG: DUF885 domain-containing protein [Gammaproteobacteria bacterium]|nr:DUF885 domain-containing protein [Gammaproteobacteria bacterium]